MANVLVAHISDTHPNSCVGLYAPPGIRTDNGWLVPPNDGQLALWKAHLEFWDEVDDLADEYDCEVWTVFGGDGTDDNRHSKHGLLTPNISDALKITEATFEPAKQRSSKIFYVRGTEAHTGGAGELEELAAHRVGAVQDPETGRHSWYSLPLEVNDVLQLYAHHPPSNSTRPWTLGNGANRTAVILTSDFAKTGDQPPQFAVYGHVHHYESSGDTHPVQVFFSPGWCLTDAFGHRIGFSGRLNEVGGLIFIIKEDGSWLFKKKVFQAPRRKSFIVTPES